MKNYYVFITAAILAAGLPLAASQAQGVGSVVLQTQINVLLNQVAELQAKLAILKGGATVHSSVKSITLISPVPGSELRAGSTQNIEWTGANLTHGVEIWYSYGGVWTLVTTANCCGSQSVTWTVPTSTGNLWLFIQSDYTPAAGWAVSDFERYSIM